MEISIRRFGSPLRQMVGLLQAPQAGKPRRPAFLMCRPFGQEAVRTAAIYRAMSDRLAREGCTILTFDQYGCGDSPGDPDEQGILDWADDTLAADAQLRADSPGTPLHWFAMGLGANSALRAAARARTAPQCLVLWEPVLDGPAYLDRLKSVHREELSRELDLAWHHLIRRGEREPELPGNVLGFTVGARLHADLQQLQQLPLAEAIGRGTRVVLAVQPEQLAAFEQRVGVTLHSVETPTNWMSTEALGTAIVPQDIPRTLLATL